MYCTQKTQMYAIFWQSNVGVWEVAFSNICLSCLLLLSSISQRRSFKPVKRFHDGILPSSNLKYIFLIFSFILLSVRSSTQLCAGTENLLIKGSIVSFLMSVFWCILSMGDLFPFNVLNFSWNGIGRKIPVISLPAVHKKTYLIS